MRQSISYTFYYVTSYIVVGHAVAKLVEALRYKPEGRGFNSRRRRCIFFQ
jgi:hypothetical protein